MSTLMILMPIIAASIAAIAGVILTLIGRKVGKPRIFWLGIAIVIFSGITIFVEFEEIREILTAFAVIVTAIVAAYSITEARRLRQDNVERENRDRKEHSLNEIIEWAIDISKWRPKEIHKDLVGIRNMMNRQELIDAHIATIMDNLIEMRERNQYIFRIALKVVEQLGKAATHNLIKEVHNLIGEVQEYIDFLAEWKAVITEAMAKAAVVDDGGYFEKAEHSEYELEKSVKKVIDEATNLY